MKLSKLLIIIYVAIGVQIGLARAVRVENAMPGFAVLAAIYIALHARREMALFGCLFLGFVQDICSLGALGLHAVAYGLVAMFVISTQQAVYRGKATTHFVLGLIGSLLSGLVICLHGWIRGPADTGAMTAFYSAIYTAILAPLVLGILQRLKIGNFSYDLARSR